MMVRELQSHVKLSSRMDKDSCSIQRNQDAMTVMVREDEDLPIFIKRDISNIKDGNYLERLLQVYEDQIKTLKGEIMHKNNIILDLLSVVKSTRENPTQEALSKESISNGSISNGSIDVQADQCHDNRDSQIWQQPKRPAKAKNTSHSSQLALSNRYDLLKDNEWLRDADNSENNQSNLSQSVQDNKTAKKAPRNKRIITIAGDSMLKDVKQWHVQNTIPGNKIYVKCFPGATTNDMRDYLKPSMRHDPDLILIHAGTNSLNSAQTPLEIADDIIDLASSSKTEDNDVVISSIIRRGDALNNKANEVNKILAEKCLALDIGFQNNNNIQLKHLQGNGHWGGIHLNSSGTNIFKTNLFDTVRF